MSLKRGLLRRAYTLEQRGKCELLSSPALLPKVQEQQQQAGDRPTDANRVAALCWARAAGAGRQTTAATCSSSELLAPPALSFSLLSITGLRPT